MPAVLQNNPSLVNNIKHNLKSNQLSRETDVIHLNLTGLHGGHYLDPSNANIFGQPGTTVKYSDRPNTNGNTYNPDPNIMPPQNVTAVISGTQIGSRNFNDGTKALEVAPATVRVLDKDGWIQVMNQGTIPNISEASKLIWLKKGNNSAGLASLYPNGLSLEEVEELVSIAFSNPLKRWGVGGNSSAWESVISFKGRQVKFSGFGTQGTSVETDIFASGFITDVN